MNKKISQLLGAATLLGGELVPVVQNGSIRQTTLGTLVKLAETNLASLNVSNNSVTANDVPLIYVTVNGGRKVGIYKDASGGEAGFFSDSQLGFKSNAGMQFVTAGQTLYVAYAFGALSIFGGDPLTLGYTSESRTQIRGKLGVGTPNPNANLSVAAQAGQTSPVMEVTNSVGTTKMSVGTTGDIRIEDAVAGVVLTSPSGAHYRLKVNDAGVVSTEIA